jgi:hypothetical protein
MRHDGDVAEVLANGHGARKAVGVRDLAISVMGRLM